MPRHTLQLPRHLERPVERSLQISGVEEPVHDFLSVLSRMTPAERLSASRHGAFSRHERSIWAARFPEDVPFINGELEWIALGGADLD
jgi:hypothetical protein